MQRVQQEESIYSKGWNLACRHYSPERAKEQGPAVIFNEHCQESGIAPVVVPCYPETAQAFSGFVAAWMYLDENLRAHTRRWQLFTANLSGCAKRVGEIYYYQTHEDQGNHDWRVYAPRLLGNNTTGELGMTIPLFADWIDQQMRARNPHATALCIMEQDTSWFGNSVQVDAETKLWVFANIYICASESAAADYQGGKEPIARIYRYDFPPEEDANE